MVDIVTGLAAIGQALEITRKLKELDKALGEAEYKLQIAELYTSLSDAKMALADAREALQAKDAEIARLKSVAADKVPTVKIGQFNFGIGPDGKVYQWAFCPTCEQVSGLQIPISPTVGRHSACPKCKGNYDFRATSKPAGYKLPEGFQSSTS